MVKIHIKRLFFGDFDAMFKKIHGKELSYNNLLDVDAAVNLIAEFKTQLLPFKTQQRLRFGYQNFN
jgi:hypothetical protein